MNTLNIRITNLSYHLQTLMTPDYYSKVQAAADKKDQNRLIRICKKAKIPAEYIASVVSVVLSVQPMGPKWPEIV